MSTFTLPAMKHLNLGNYGETPAQRILGNRGKYAKGGKVCSRDKFNPGGIVHDEEDDGRPVYESKAAEMAALAAKGATGMNKPHAAHMKAPILAKRDRAPAHNFNEHGGYAKPDIAAAKARMAAQKGMRNPTQGFSRDEWAARKEGEAKMKALDNPANRAKFDANLADKRKENLESNKMGPAGQFMGEPRKIQFKNLEKDRAEEAAMKRNMAATKIQSAGRGLLARNKAGEKRWGINDMNLVR